MPYKNHQDRLANRRLKRRAKSHTKDLVTCDSCKTTISKYAPNKYKHKFDCEYA